MRPDPLQHLADELASLEDQQLYRRLRILSGEQRGRAVFDGREVVNLSSNNYLGLTTHPKLRERAIQATKDLGVGSGAVRSIAGTMANPYGAGTTARGVQADRRRGGVSERVCRQRRYGCGDADREMTWSSPMS